jgi:hypothetical protein
MKLDINFTRLLGENKKDQRACEINLKLGVKLL